MLTCVPAQHWSARTPWDTNRRLRGGWVLAGQSRRAFVAGDSGYSDGSREIGERLGPLDIAAVSIAAYEPRA
jgi:L-ascorbate metabolism protein UlaG (beta-lactamase superfamily)